MVDNNKELDLISEEISSCTLCPLNCTRNKTVPGVGNTNADIVFLGEAPGEEEDRSGLPFVGRAGQLLTKMIEALGLHRDDVFILNVNKCRPPGNRTPTIEEMSSCLPFLDRQIKLIKPRVIFALGKTAGVGLKLLEPTESLGSKRGIIHQWEGIPVILSYHPSYLLRSPEMKRESWKDLKMLITYITKKEGC